MICFILNLIKISVEIFSSKIRKVVKREYNLKKKKKKTVNVLYVVVL